jgi:CDP-glucose 4,6-dehydratase
VVDREFWRGKRVFLTGHTGFKGGWLTTWLLDMGAHVSGFALAPDTEPSYFALCRLGERMTSTLGDVRGHDDVRRALGTAAPDVVFHLAAQALVRRSYRVPLETFATNVMGTAHVLEAARHAPSVRAIVVVTSDKCYESSAVSRAYREDDALGGHDPYSASKACAELVTLAYRRSFLDPAVPTATARAGNVIGGGDWAEDRVVPDAVRALQGGGTLMVRHPGARRPWQHVLEPLAGYLMLAQRLHEGDTRLAEAWNFGPSEGHAETVATLADHLVRAWGSGRWQAAPDAADEVHEAARLELDSAKARERLGWQPFLTLAEAVDATIEWYRRAERAGAATDMYDVSLGQIRAYVARAKT